MPCLNYCAQCQQAEPHCHQKWQNGGLYSKEKFHIPAFQSCQYTLNASVLAENQGGKGNLANLSRFIGGFNC
jgi:hypothetical protein